MVSSYQDNNDASFMLTETTYMRPAPTTVRTTTRTTTTTTTTTTRRYEEPPYAQGSISSEDLRLHNQFCTGDKNFNLSPNPSTKSLLSSINICNQLRRATRAPTTSPARTTCRTLTSSASSCWTSTWTGTRACRPCGAPTGRRPPTGSTPRQTWPCPHCKSINCFKLY